MLLYGWLRQVQPGKLMDVGQFPDRNRPDAQRSGDIKIIMPSGVPIVHQQHIFRPHSSLLYIRRADLGKFLHQVLPTEHIQRHITFAQFLGIGDSKEVPRIPLDGQNGQQHHHQGKTQLQVEDLSDLGDGIEFHPAVDPECRYQHQRKESGATPMR